MSSNLSYATLAIQRVLTPGSGEVNKHWPHFTITKYGETFLTQPHPTHCDPDGYLALLDSLCPNLDAVTKEYVREGLACMRGSLVFAAAVMFGAAAEKTVLLLLKAIHHAETSAKNKKQAEKLLDSPNLPGIFLLIEKRIEALTKGKAAPIPYAVHRGCTQHLLSLFEMIRVQRNDAVHPQAGQCSREKVFLTIQSFPGALEVVYRLINWFSNNKI